MAYANPLHPPINSSQYSSYSTLGGAVSKPGDLFQSPFRRWLPQASYTPASKWRSATGTSNRHIPAIAFDYIGYSKQGVPMLDLSTRSVQALSQMLAGANDHVFAQSGLQRITLRIMWPGYTHIDWARSIDLVSNGPITRAQLALVISTYFARFVETARTERPSIVEYSIAASAIQYEHLVLVGLHNVFEDVWQADVAIDRR